MCQSSAVRVRVLRLWIVLVPIGLMFNRLGGLIVIPCQRRIKLDRIGRRHRHRFVQTKQKISILPRHFLLLFSGIGNNLQPICASQYVRGTTTGGMTATTQPHVCGHEPTYGSNENRLAVSSWLNLGSGRCYSLYSTLRSGCNGNWGAFIDIQQKQR